MNFNKAEFAGAAGTSKQLIESDLPEVVFSGRSNVGKSSLINKLLSRKSLARVSATPGKTATINFFKCDGFFLVDLPGYGYAKVSQSEKKRWAELVEGYFAQERKIALVVQIVDMRHPATPDDMQMLEFLSANGLPYIVVLTKKDKLNKTEQQNRLKAFEEQFKNLGNIKMYAFSALKGDGTEEIRNAVSACVEEYGKE
ncbi:MAG: ribosome biogenesis GTP-binding protein YihA/YsxC [Clostridiales bacterium]|nr:ribosome biogenesis GTP-binding protein YihA/YsxC [Clostridiales bacterium]